jgi:hypothetical protein
MERWELHCKKFRDLDRSLGVVITAKPGGCEGLDVRRTNILVCRSLMGTVRETKLLKYQGRNEIPG